jgi:hypothetical protein
LLGWLAFWLTTAVQPCDIVLAAQPNQHSAAPAASSVSLHSVAEHSREPAPAGSHCPDLSAVAAVATSAATQQDYNLDNHHPSPGFEIFVAPRHGAALDLVYDTFPPPPPIPLYLRTARLLI